MAVEYLHQNNILYRNIKPESLLFTANHYLKFNDMSLAKIVETKTYTVCGTPEYMAPEIILNHGQCKAVDFWALGILIYEILSGFFILLEDLLLFMRKTHFSFMKLFCTIKLSFQKILIKMHFP